MPSTVERLGSTRAKLTIEIPAADLEPAIRKAYRQLAQQISIPGFRKGHVPDALIDARVGRTAVVSEAVNALMPSVYARALQEHNLSPLGQPDIELTRMEDGEGAEFTAEVDIVPDFDLPDASQISVTVPAIGNLDHVVEERIGILRDRFAETEEVDRESRDGDQVTINLVATRDGKPLPDAESNDLTYVIGSGAKLEGLDDAVKGLKAGEDRTFSSKLNEDEEPADVTVTVTKVHKRTLPALDDDFAQLVSHLDTVEEMRQDLAAAVQRQARFEQLTVARDQVLGQAIEMAGIDVPDRLVEAEAANRVSQLEEQVKAAGLTLEAYLARVGEPGAKTRDEYAETIRASVAKGLRSEILLTELAEKTDVPVSQEDLTNFLFQKAQENGSTPQQELEHMQEHDHFQEYVAQIRTSKALDDMVRQARITDADGNLVDFNAMPESEEVSDQG